MESREQAAPVTSNRGITLWQYDVDSDVIRLDPDLAISLGLDPNDMKTRGDWMARVHPDDRPQLERRRRELFAPSKTRAPEHDSTIGEYRMVHQNGSIRWFRSRMAVRRNAAGEAISAIGVIEDITDAKLARPSRESDKEIVRTAQLAVAGELVSATAHDLRQPLSALHLSLGIVSDWSERTDVPADVRRSLAAAADQLQRIKESLRSLEDLVEQRELRREMIDPAGPLAEVVRMVSIDAQRRHVTIQLALDPDLPAIYADPLRLRHAFLALIFDALEVVPTTNTTPITLTLGANHIEGGIVEFRIEYPGEVHPGAMPVWGLTAARLIAEAHDASLTVVREREDAVAIRIRWALSPLSALAAQSQEIS